MILPDAYIRTALSCSEPWAYVPGIREEFGRIDDTQVQPASLDVRLGPDFTDPFTGETGTWSPDGDPFRLRPGQCVLGNLVERFAIPADIVARVEGKSTWARRFLTVHSAGFVDPGFRGDLTLELKNDGHQTLELWPGTRIAQISFQMMSAAAAAPYGSPGLGSHYQHQTGATPAAR